MKEVKKDIIYISDIKEEKDMREYLIFYLKHSIETLNEITSE